MNSNISPSFKIFDQDIKVFTTKDPQLLKQFYTLRENSYRNENGWVNYDGQENEFDRNSDILIATNPNNEVVCGIRIMFEDNYHQFYCETPNSKFQYRKYLEYKKETVSNGSIAEFSSFVVSKNYRNTIFLCKFGEIIVNFAKSKNAKIIFIISTQKHCRFYKIMSSKINYKTIFDKSFPWKKERKYSNVETFLIYLKFQN